MSEVTQVAHTAALAETASLQQQMAIKLLEETFRMQEEALKQMLEAMGVGCNVDVVA